MFKDTKSSDSIQYLLSVVHRNFGRTFPIYREQQ